MSDDLNPDMRQLVDLARKARTPGAHDKLRIAERLAVPLAAGAAAGTVATAAKATGTLASLGAKLAAVVAVGAAATALVVTQLRAPASPIAGATPSQGATTPTPTRPTSTAPSAATTPEPAPPAIEAPAPHKPNAAPSAAHGTKGAAELAEEAALLHQAQSTWRAGQSSRALALANEHAQRFPRSQLASERDVLRVLSLCKLGQVKSAKQIGAHLLKKSKGSPWYQSVAESCAAD